MFENNFLIFVRSTITVVKSMQKCQSKMTRVAMSTINSLIC